MAFSVKYIGSENYHFYSAPLKSCSECAMKTSSCCELWEISESCIGNIFTTCSFCDWNNGNEFL